MVVLNDTSKEYGRSSVTQQASHWTSGDRNIYNDSFSSQSRGEAYRYDNYKDRIMRARDEKKYNHYGGSRFRSGPYVRHSEQKWCEKSRKEVVGTKIGVFNGASNQKTRERDGN